MSGYNTRAGTGTTEARMWFAYGFPIAWFVLFDSAFACICIGTRKQCRRLVEVGAWLSIGYAVLVLIGFVPIFVGLVRAMLSGDTGY
jgi:hypothetical protein